MENPVSKVAKEPRDEKSQEQMEKSLGLTGTYDEKYQNLLKRVTESEKENKKLLGTLKLQDKRYEALLREKENLQKEHNKNVLMRTKLEQVCREQQKLLKSVQNESMKHKETQAKFQHSINEISLTLNKNNEENIKLKEDNIEMTKKLKYLGEQYQIREKQLEKINEQVLLENQLHEAKLAKAQMEATMEKEILLKEKQCALDELLKCKKNIQELQNREESLKEQLSLYTSKYDDFQSSLQKSNDVFATYKTELEKMVKKTKKLEKESLEWKRKCERSAANLVDLATQNQTKDEYITKTGKQLQQLQKLLRTLQAERSILYKTLKENNIDTPTMPVLPPEPEPVTLPQPPLTKQPDKIESMAKSCAELKQSLAILQNQMTALTKKQPIVSEPQTNDPAPKSKSKRNKAKNKSSIKENNATQLEVESKENIAVEVLNLESGANMFSKDANHDVTNENKENQLTENSDCNGVSINGSGVNEINETQNDTLEKEAAMPASLICETATEFTQKVPDVQQTINNETNTEKSVIREITTADVNVTVDESCVQSVLSNSENI